MPCPLFGLEKDLDGFLSLSSTSGGSTFRYRLAFFKHSDLQKASLIMTTVREKRDTEIKLPMTKVVLFIIELQDFQVCKKNKAFC